MASRPANSSVGPKAVQSQIVSPAALQLSSALSGALQRCWKRAAAPKDWHLAREQFMAVLERSVAHRFGDRLPAEKAVEEYLDGLHAHDLALASACSAGNLAAWEFFVSQFRPELYRAARAIAGQANSRELADSLYGDLYALGESDCPRKSLFDYFHGRSKLTTWLRAVLAQRHVDEIRRTRKAEPLEDETGTERREINEQARAREDSNRAAPDTEKARYTAELQATLTAVLTSLYSRDRLRLAYYYADGRTLAEIGRLLGEHEATVSRKLERTRRDVRARVETVLREQKNFSDAQVRLCFAYARGEWPFDLSEALRSDSSSPKLTQQPDVPAPD